MLFSIWNCHRVIIRRIQDLGLWWTSRSPKAQEYRGAREYMGLGYGDGCPSLGWYGSESAFSPEKFSFGSPNAYFGPFLWPIWVFCFCTILRPDLLYACPLWHSRLTVAQSKALSSRRRVYQLIINIFPGKWIRDKFNNCQRQNTESRRQQFSQLFVRRSWVGGGAWPLGPLWIRQCLIFSIY